MLVYAAGLLGVPLAVGWHVCWDVHFGCATSFRCCYHRSAAATCAMARGVLSVWMMDACMLGPALLAALLLLCFSLLFDRKQALLLCMAALIGAMLACMMD